MQNLSKFLSHLNCEERCDYAKMIDKFSARIFLFFVALLETKVTLKYIDQLETQNRIELGNLPILKD